ncbi:hypothetical protein ACFQYP_23415 [Nonomuraea antimicrobica]|uniref:hypothetical protein n=1 Tax=Nonomuraea antimicrobica TaxID=561173 RepID=UPI0031E641E5
MLSDPSRRAFVAPAASVAAIDEASRRGIANKLGDILGGARDFPYGDGGGVVLVPEGVYRLSAVVNVRDSVRVIGFGRRRPRFVLGANTPPSSACSRTWTSTSATAVRASTTTPT